MSVKGYVIINNILKINIEKRRDFRGCEIDDVHMLLEKYLNVALLLIQT
jgi:hypothetical protein